MPVISLSPVTNGLFDVVQVCILCVPYTGNPVCVLFRENMCPQAALLALLESSKCSLNSRQSHLFSSGLKI